MVMERLEAAKRHHNNRSVRRQVAIETATKELNQANVFDPGSIVILSTEKTTKFEGDGSSYILSEDAAEILGFDVSQVRRLALRGDLDGIKIGKIWFINSEAVNNYQRKPVGRPPLERPS